MVWVRSYTSGSLGVLLALKPVFRSQREQNGGVLLTAGCARTAAARIVGGVVGGDIVDVSGRLRLAAVEGVRFGCRPLSERQPAPTVDVAVAAWLAKRSRGQRVPPQFVEVVDGPVVV